MQSSIILSLLVCSRSFFFSSIFPSFSFSFSLVLLFSLYSSSFFTFFISINFLFIMIIQILWINHHLIVKKQQKKRRRRMSAFNSPCNPEILLLCSCSSFSLLLHLLLLHAKILIFLFWFLHSVHTLIRTKVPIALRFQINNKYIYVYNNYLLLLHLF